MKNLLCSVLQATLALASTVAATTTTFNANYEDINTTEVGVGTAVGTYKSLTYQSFEVLTNAAGLVGGIVPHSETNFIGTVPPPTASGTPNITVALPYITFSLKSFWFGCEAITGQGFVSEVVQCTVTVAAFKKGQEVAVASYTFTPPTEVVKQTPMIQAVLPKGFENVFTVTFAHNTPTVVGLGIDNIQYTATK